MMLGETLLWLTMYAGLGIVVALKALALDFYRDMALGGCLLPVNGAAPFVIAQRVSLTQLRLRCLLLSSAIKRFVVGEDVVEVLASLHASSRP